jgi:hypothetical protein
MPSDPRIQPACVPVYRRSLPGEGLAQRVYTFGRVGPFTMRIATYNVNGVNGRLANLLGWLHEAAPDIVCLQS